MQFRFLVSLPSGHTFVFVACLSSQVEMKFDNAALVNLMYTAFEN